MLEHGGLSKLGYSDDRIKYNEEELGDCLSLINQVQTYKYDKILKNQKIFLIMMIGCWILVISFNDVSNNV